MNWKHALIELFFLGAGVFAVWVIYDTLRRHWHHIVAAFEYGIWTPANPDNEADPVGRIGNDWGFWDETWSVWHGGYANEPAARAGLEKYVRECL